MTQRESLHNPYRLSIEQFLRFDGRTLEEILAAVVCDIEPAPALCTQVRSGMGRQLSPRLSFSPLGGGPRVKPAAPCCAGYRQRLTVLVLTQNKQYTAELNGPDHAILDG